MEFHFSEIEKRAKEIWAVQEVYRTETDRSKPKYYVLDMFPYPSGAGLHVGHPLGYIASDIIARYKRLKGFNVLHPMGYDSFGLPAEQYAIQTGQHPAITTEANINTFRSQMDKLGFSYDWKRELRTSDPKFYKWTQWIFIQLFHSWYNTTRDRAEPIATLLEEFETHGAERFNTLDGQTEFTAQEWKNFSSKQQSEILLQHRLAYIADAWVNWCPALGTVLANDEVKDGVSERGGYPVERKLMPQWSLRITSYAERLLKGLDAIDWSESIKEAQRNWIGKSEGCTLQFKVWKDATATVAPSGQRHEDSTSGSPYTIEVFTTRPDTIFGVSFITLAPEHELVKQLTAPAFRDAVEKYVAYATNRSERERISDVRKITGQFTGAYVLHPFSGAKIPVWIGEYVLAGYGTGAVMAVPGHDARDYAFAKFFEKELTDQLGHPPIVEVISGGDLSKEAHVVKEGICINSDFLNGLPVTEAIHKAIEKIEAEKIGVGKINYRMRDAIFGRQRYWGEPIPVYYDEQGIPHTIDEKDLPLKLPEVDKYLPTESGEPPLARAAANWKYRGKYDYELTTMPGWAGSSWYYLRYEDPHNENAFATADAIDYWQNIDFYLGGDEHATGHLLYFRFWTKFLYDRGWVPFDEPAKKLLNQGKIQGRSCLLTVLDTGAGKLEVFSKNIFEGRAMATAKENGAAGVSNQHAPRKMNISVECCNDDKVDIEKLKAWRDEFKHATYHFEKDGSLLCELVVEKMSKSKYNVINPDDVLAQYGADAFRMYEMFLGPIEQHKPWDTKGIDGVYRFLKKLWKLFYDEQGNWLPEEGTPAKEELKVLHRTIKKVAEDVDRLSFNTSVSAFMICVNELSQLKSNKWEILMPLLIILNPYAPFVTEYLWWKAGNKKSIVHAAFPDFDASLLEENTFEYPVAVNGKTRLKMQFALDVAADEMIASVKSFEGLQKYLEGKEPKKVIVVKGRMINVVV